MRELVMSLWAGDCSLCDYITVGKGFNLTSCKNKWYPYQSWNWRPYKVTGLFCRCVSSLKQEHGFDRTAKPLGESTHFPSPIIGHAGLHISQARVWLEKWQREAERVIVIRIAWVAVVLKLRLCTEFESLNLLKVASRKTSSSHAIC